MLGPMSIGALSSGGAAAEPVNVEITAIDDTRLKENNSSANFGSSTVLYAGEGNVLSSKVTRMLIKADLSSIPAGSTIQSATLTLKLTFEGSTTDYDATIHRALTEWFEGVKDEAAPDAAQDGSTWDERNANGSVAWAGADEPSGGGGAGADYATTPTDTVTIVGPAGTTSDFDVTADLTAWVTNSEDNFGWWIKIAEGVAVNTIKGFHSFEAASADDRPVLAVTYVPT